VDPAQITKDPAQKDDPQCLFVPKIQTPVTIDRLTSAAGYLGEALGSAALRAGIPFDDDEVYEGMMIAFQAGFEGRALGMTRITDSIGSEPERTGNGSSSSSSSSSSTIQLLPKKDQKTKEWLMPPKKYPKDAKWKGNI
jgi:hypothetical protein